MSYRGLVACNRVRWAGSHPIVRSFPQGAIIVFDADLRYLYAGGLGLADVGLSREMLEGNTIDAVFPPEVVTVTETRYRQALAGRESVMDVPFEGRIYQQRLGPLRDAAGMVVPGMGFTQDVTASRRSEWQMRESEENFRLAFEYAPIPKTLIDLDGRCLQVNPAIREFTGYSDHQLVGMSLADFARPGTTSCVGWTPGGRRGTRAGGWCGSAAPSSMSPIRS